ncbi:MAG: DUF72 domain-containing protein [archaeon]|nr:DUF72 domain-containing protein [archaeon]
MEIIAGCCGNAGLSLKDYSDNFEVIEIQSTFYRLPSVKTAENWRQQVKRDFIFTMKVFQGITHPISSPTWRKAGSQKPIEKIENYGHLKPNEQNFECWANIVKICKALNAKACVIQLPPSFTCNEENSKNIIEFFKNVERPFAIAIEVRHRSWDDDPEMLKKSLKEIEAIHVVDPLIKKPFLKSDIGYYRLHGLGKRLDYRYQYNDGELIKLLEEVKKIGCRESFVMFNNIPMREDAIRFKRLVKDGFVPFLDGKSLEDRLRIILKGIRFPIKARELSDKRGYLLIRVNKKTFTLAVVIKMIGLKEFDSINELLNAIKVGSFEKWEG